MIELPYMTHATVLVIFIFVILATDRSIQEQVYIVYSPDSANWLLLHTSPAEEDLDGVLVVLLEALSLIFLEGLR